MKKDWTYIPDGPMSLRFRMRKGELPREVALPEGADGNEPEELLLPLGLDEPQSDDEPDSADDIH